MPEIKPRKTLFNPELRRRGIYLLPNLFTTAALFCGFFAIVQAMKGGFEAAAVAIFVAMVLDGLDGRVARMTRTQSAFGAEYDSLSDMVSFGVAPALVSYAWALKDLGRLGWIAAFIYCAGAALRLARFNTTLEVIDKRYFQGLPSPAAAALVTAFLWVMIDKDVAAADVRWAPVSWWFLPVSRWSPTSSSTASRTSICGAACPSSSWSPLPLASPLCPTTRRLPCLAFSWPMRSPATSSR
jgi:CDP-diacylglycerol--serine O-phosphatidyltransferase